jgi:hypothetical protein
MHCCLAFFNTEIAVLSFRSNLEESTSVKSIISVKDPDLVENEGNILIFMRITKCTAHHMLGTTQKLTSSVKELPCHEKKKFAVLKP